MHHGNAGNAKTETSLGFGRGKRLAGTGHYEPTIIHQLLPGCPCGSPHPIALRASDPLTCPGCGRSAQPPSNPVTDRAILTDRRMRLGVWLVSIGERLNAWAKRIR